MNVFIDTNLLLDFYRMGKDKLDELEKVFALHSNQRLKLWLPEQIINEFWRNRAKVVAEHTKDIEKDYRPSLPHIFREHAELQKFSEHVNEANKIKNTILKDVQEQFATETLAADIVIKKIFDAASKIKADEEMIARGQRRYDLGNPPGKNKSYGDAVNWECLLSAIPHGEDLYIITEDSDYKSAFIKDSMNEYMKHEWKSKKESEPHMYARLSEFIKTHFPEATNLAEMEVNLTIKELEESPNFATTHRVIEKLNNFQTFNQNQIMKLINIYFDNDQVGYIRKDADIKRFANLIISQCDKEKDTEGLADYLHKYVNGKIEDLA